MKKLFFMLLGIAATINVMAVDYTAKAKITVESSTGYSCIVRLSEAAEYGALNGNEMYMEGRKIALYALNGTTKLENARAASLDGVKLGLMTDNGTDYTFTITNVEGSNPLYLMDGETGTNYLLDGTSFTIYGLTANTTIEDRFTLGRPSAPATGYNVTLNDDYLATFSAAEDVEIPAGLTAWYSVDGIEGDVLTLLQVSGKIPANTGVVLYNANGDEKNFSLPITTGADAIATNLLKPASAWASHSGTIYILHGHELWVYEGTEMKENKAYLQIETSGAPARIRLAFGQTTGVENVEAEAVKAEKFVENGQIFIRRGNEVFNLQGQKQR